MNAHDTEALFVEALKAAFMEGWEACGKSMLGENVVTAEAAWEASEVKRDAEGGAE